ncbi:MAG: helical backbone metal receptor [Bacteroidota bacterium]
MSSFRHTTDQMGRAVRLPHPPQRIVSTVPSQTELLYDLGLGDRVVGITKFCEAPPHWRREKTLIGGTKRFHFDRIDTLQPDLIIGNKEENEKSQIERLARRYPVWMSDIATLDDALAMIAAVGDLVDRTSQAQQLKARIQVHFEQLARDLAGQPRQRVAYLIWRKPYMVAASGTFIHHLLDRAGYDNVFADRQRYPTVSAAELQATAPDCLFLSSEPFPFRERHCEELRDICPASVIQLVDGGLFSWYGSRLLHAAPYFLNLRVQAQN